MTGSLLIDQDFMECQPRILITAQVARMQPKGFNFCLQYLDLISFASLAKDPQCDVMIFFLRTKTNILSF